MASSLQKVKRGDPLVIPATTFNTFVDAARDFQDRQRSAERRTQRDQLDTGIILIRNESGADRERFDVLGIEGPIIARGDNQAEFLARVALRGVTPSAAHPGRFVLLLEPARPMAIVRALVAGVGLARVRMLDETHPAADIAVGNPARLDSAVSGAARLLWIEPPADRDTPDVAWAVLRLGGASAPSATAERYRLRRAAGSAGGEVGDFDTPPSLAYDVFALTADVELDDPLYEAVPVSNGTRRVPGKWLPARDGSIGEGFFDFAADEFVLLVAWDEAPDPHVCQVTGGED